MAKIITKSADLRIAESTKEIKEILKKNEVKKYPKDLLDLYDWMDDNLTQEVCEEITPHLAALSRALFG